MESGLHSKSAEHREAAGNANIPAVAEEFFRVSLGSFGRSKKRTDILYAITSRKSYGENEAHARECLLRQTAVWAANRVAYIQLREKDLSARDQVGLARAMMKMVRSEGRGIRTGRPTRLLINGRPDVALAAGADGVHLPSADFVTPEEVRRLFAAAGRHVAPVISISCHTLDEIEVARSQNPDCILFAPVFEKILAAARDESQESKIPGVGPKQLQQACRTAAPMPVFALGGITAENAGQCIEAGATGVAAIRWMQEPPAAWSQFA